MDRRTFLTASALMAGYAAAAPWQPAMASVPAKGPPGPNGLGDAVRWYATHCYTCGFAYSSDYLAALNRRPERLWCEVCKWHLPTSVGIEDPRPGWVMGNARHGARLYTPDNLPGRRALVFFRHDWEWFVLYGDGYGPLRGVPANNPIDAMMNAEREVISPERRYT